MKIRLTTENIVIHNHVHKAGDIIDLEIPHAQKSWYVSHHYAEWMEDPKPGPREEPPRPEAAALDHGAVETTALPKPQKKGR